MRTATRGALARLVGEERVTVAHFVPSVLGPFLDAVERPRGAGDPPGGYHLRRLFSSGEALTPSLARRAATVFPAAEVHNLYGPTEAAVEVSGWRYGPGDDVTVPIGHPMPGCSLYVLDGRLRPVPQGVAGELYIGGPQLARGYLSAAAATARAFLPDPFAPAPGARMYRTGDRVVRREDGAVVFLGRLDLQLKIRGERVEPAEVEAVLRACPGVLSAAVRWEDAGGHGSLVAYVVPDPHATPADLRPYLAARLPRVMVPRRVVRCRDVRVTPSGKLDYAALQAPDGGSRDGGPPDVALIGGEPVDVEAAGEQDDAPPQGREQGVAVVLAEALGMPQLGRREDFFDAGGHSMLAVEALARLTDQFGVELPLRSFLQDPTVAGITEALAAARRAPRARRGPVAGRDTRPVLVTGATGMVGSFVVQELRRRGHRLRLFVRRGAAVQDDGSDEWSVGDFADPDSVARAARGAEGVVHLGCTFRYWRQDAAAMERLIAEWAAGPLVLMSTTDVYPRSAPAPIDETCPLQAAEQAVPYVRGKLHAERLLHAAAAALGRSDISTLRPPFVWGPHPYCRWQLRTAAGYAFYRAVAAGSTLTLPPGDPADVAFSWVDARDLAVLVADCLAEPVAGALNVVTGQVSWSAFYQELSRRTGHAPPVRIGEVPPDDLHARTRRYATTRLRARGFRPVHTEWQEVPGLVPHSAHGRRAAAPRTCSMTPA